MKIMKIPSTKI